MDRVHPTWTVIVPVKPPLVGKARLAPRRELAAAIALDTIEAASRAARVREVVVVTSDAAFADDAAAIPSVRVVVESDSRGIAAAIAAGARDVVGPVVALLGDLPALRSAELDAVLVGSARGAFVPDAEGTGTSLVMAASATELRTAFGPDSARAHRDLGLTELDVPADSGLRRDVDDSAQLHQAAELGLGRRTAALL
jgi:2-phospho-L-lactate guanylyltransferase